MDSKIKDDMAKTERNVREIILREMAKRILVIDGAMGTMGLQRCAVSDPP